MRLEVRSGRLSVLRDLLSQRAHSLHPLLRMDWLPLLSRAFMRGFSLRPLAFLGAANFGRAAGCVSETRCGDC